MISFLTIFTLTDIGLRQPRLEGDEYISVVDELMEALHARWPKAIVQVHFFKSFQMFGFLCMLNLYEIFYDCPC